MPHISDLNHHDCTTLSEFTCMSIHTYCILFPANKCFTFFTTSHLYGKFISTFHWLLVIGPAARLSTFITAAQPQSLAGNRNPVSSCSKSKPPEIREIKRKCLPIEMYTFIGDLKYIWKKNIICSISKQRMS